MPYKGRAFYNLLQMNLKRNSKLEVETWQVEDYQTLLESELFSRLETHQIFLEKEEFLLLVDKHDSPEDLVNSLYFGGDFKAHQQVFLCIFELWRRFCFYKQSLSLFCDELDHLIEEYEEGNLREEDELQAELLSLQRILDDHVDEGGDPLEGLELFSHFSCHDLEVFIYKYISDQFNLENELYASELLEGFYPYIRNKRWFDFLRTRGVIATDLKEGMIILERLFESLREKPDIHLFFEVLHFLVSLGETEQFLSIFNHTLHQIKTEDDLRELMNIFCDYLNCIDREKEEKEVQELLEKRRDKSPQAPINKNDDFLQVLKNLIKCSLT